MPSLARAPLDRAALSPEDRLRDQLRAVWAGRDLRRGTTAVYVADASSGEPLYGVYEDRPLNPASNVKLVSTATALAVLGPAWRYVTQLLGPEPDATGILRGDLYLLGNADPTLRSPDLQELADQLAARGVRHVTGAVRLSADERRDTLGHAALKINVRGTSPGQPPAVELDPPLPGLVRVSVRAETSRQGRRPRLRVAARLRHEGTDAVLEIAIAGRIPAGRAAAYWHRAGTPALLTGHALLASLERAGITVGGGVVTGELDAYVAAATVDDYLPVPLARHESESIGELVARINKPSDNFLADRLTMTVGAARFGGAPSLRTGVAAMNEWLSSVGIDTHEIVLDTGSGLSHKSKMSPRQIVLVLRAGAGFVAAARAASDRDSLPSRALGGGLDGVQALHPAAADHGPAAMTAAQAYVASLAVGGVDGTLRRRFQRSPAWARVAAKTGTLTRVIALAGFVGLEQGKPVAFALLTNGHRESRRNVVRSRHEVMVEAVLAYAVPAAGTRDTSELALARASATANPIDGGDDSGDDPGGAADGAANPVAPVADGGASDEPAGTGAFAVARADAPDGDQRPEPPAQAAQPANTVVAPPPGVSIAAARKPRANAGTTSAASSAEPVAPLPGTVPAVPAGDAVAPLPGMRPRAPGGEAVAPLPAITTPAPGARIPAQAAAARF